MPQNQNVDVKTLKTRAHHLPTIVQLGAAGLSDAVMREIDLALDSHELIKIRIGGEDKEERKAITTKIVETLSCIAIQQIGKQLVVYRDRPIEAPSKSAPHQPKKQIAQGVAAPTRHGAGIAKVKAKGGKTKGGKAKADPRKALRKGTSERKGGKSIRKGRR